MKYLFAINEHSGQERSPDEFEAEIKSYIEKYIPEDSSYVLKRLARENFKDVFSKDNAREYDVVVPGGGDGTINGAVNLLKNHDVIYGILPLGTFNNFATDLKIPMDIEKAVGIIFSGNAQKVDLGAVNGRYFVNNSSIGLYPVTVKIRDKVFNKLGYSRVSGMLRALLRAFSIFPAYKVRIEYQGKEEKYTTPFVFFGNNEYIFDILRLGRREIIDGGNLSMYISKCKNRLCFLKHPILNMFNKLSQDKHFVSRAVKEAVIRCSRKKLNVAMDGEAIKMKTPLEYRSAPKAISIITPKAANIGESE